jgi:hypothetical protein
MIAVAPAAVIIRNICSHHCVRRPELDTPISYAFSYETSSDTPAKVFFIPHPLIDDGYTEAQLNEIEHTLACHGFDLLPIDYNIH